MSSVRVSNHACKRMKERMGLNKKAANRIADIAYLCGISLDTAKNKLYKFIQAKENAYAQEGNKIIVYGEMVYCFVENAAGIVLLTVYRIPNDLRQCTLLQEKRLKFA